MGTEKLLRLLEPILPGEVANWRRSLPLLDAEARCVLEAHIQVIARQRLGDYENKVLLPPRDVKGTKGELALGSIVYDELRSPFGLNRPELLQGLGIYGRSGAGKTNVVFCLIQQLERARIPFLFLDWKQTCRHLLPLLKQPVNLYTPGRSLSPFAFNPLVPPPGVEERSHIAQLVEIMGAAYTLGDGSKSLLQRAFRQAYAEDGEWPTLHNVSTIVEGSPATGRAAGWKATAKRALESLVLSGAVDSAVGNQQDLLNGLLETSTIIELDGLAGGAKKFLVPTLMTWLFSYRLQARDRETLRLVIIIEEAHHLLYRAEHRTEESVMNKILRQCRELGIAAVVVDQHPHLISSAALGNTHTSICLSQKDPADINRAAALSMLREDEKQYLSRLPVGQGIVKMQDRWTRPFLVAFPHVPIQKGIVSDGTLRRILVNGHALVPRKLRVPTDPGRQNIGSNPDLSIGSPGFRLLLDCFGFPTDGIQARYRRLGISVDKGNHLKNQLIEQGLAVGASISVGRTRRFLLRPTKRAQGIALLDPTPSPGSVEHEFWKHYYAEEFGRAGWDVALEAVREGGRVDVLATKGALTIGFEVETGKSDAVSNVDNCLRAGYSLVVVVATKEAARKKVERQLAENGLLVEDRVRVVLRDGLGPLKEEAAAGR